MDGLHETSPRTRECEFMGRMVRLNQLRLRHFAEIEAAALERLPSPLAVVAPTVRDLPPEQAEYLLGRAYDDSMKARRATPREIDAFLGTLDGLAMMFWLTMRDAQPDITHDQVKEHVFSLSEDQLEELQAELDALEPPRGNVDGRQTAPAAMSDANDQPGAASSAS